MESYQVYKQASNLQKEANLLLNKLELLADHGVERAEKLIKLSWQRYQRRAYRTNQAEQNHWGTH
jgi:hypothetical protein